VCILERLLACIIFATLDKVSLVLPQRIIIIIIIIISIIKIFGLCQMPKHTHTNTNTHSSLLISDAYFLPSKKVNNVYWGVFYCQ